MTAGLAAAVGCAMGAAALAAGPVRVRQPRALETRSVVSKLGRGSPAAGGEARALAASGVAVGLLVTMRVPIALMLVLLIGLGTGGFLHRAGRRREGRR